MFSVLRSPTSPLCTRSFFFLTYNTYCFIRTLVFFAFLLMSFLFFMLPPLLSVYSCFLLTLPPPPSLSPYTLSFFPIISLLFSLPSFFTISSFLSQHFYPFFSLLLLLQCHRLLLSFNPYTLPHTLTTPFPFHTFLHFFFSSVLPNTYFLSSYFLI